MNHCLCVSWDNYLMPSNTTGSRSPPDPDHHRIPITTGSRSVLPGPTATGLPQHSLPSLASASLPSASLTYSKRACGRAHQMASRYWVSFGPCTART